MNEELVMKDLKTHEKRLNDHSSRLDKLEQNQARIETQIENLCKSIESLTNTLKWGLGLCASSLIGFFFYIVQQNILK